ncbi:MAG: zinc ribbon domain-containing protein [Polyangiaceae bacterium]
MAFVCKQCGHENDDVVTHCVQCKLFLRPRSRKRCAACGTLNHPDRTHCTGCQIDLSGPVQMRGAKKELLLALLAAGIIIPVIIWYSTRDQRGTATGQIRATGTYGDFTLAVNKCVSGQVDDFFGVWVMPELVEFKPGTMGWKGGLRLVRSGDQWAVYVSDPTTCHDYDCNETRLDPAKCKTFEVKVRDTDASRNDITAREGSARLECRDGAGSFDADVKFRGCVGFSNADDPDR